MLWGRYATPAAHIPPFGGRYAAPAAPIPPSLCILDGILILYVRYSKILILYYPVNYRVVPGKKKLWAQSSFAIRTTMPLAKLSGCLSR